VLTICTRVRVLEKTDETETTPEAPRRAPVSAFDLSHRCAFATGPAQRGRPIRTLNRTPDPVRSPEHPVRRRHLALTGSNGDVLRLGDLGVSDGSPSKRDEEESAALVEHSGKLHG
jgi:hypothetical protein